jgi:hypothetical protein
MGLVASGHVDGKRELLRRAELGDQAFNRLAQVRDGSLAAVALTVRSHTGAQLRVGTPDTVFVLFHGVWDVHGPRHGAQLLKSAHSIVAWLGRWQPDLTAGAKVYSKAEDLVHDLGAGGDHGPQFPAVDDLGGAGGGVPGLGGRSLRC